MREGAYRVHDDEDCSDRTRAGGGCRGRRPCRGRRDESVNEDAVAEIRRDEKQIQHDARSDPGWRHRPTVADHAHGAVSGAQDAREESAQRDDKQERYDPCSDLMHEEAYAEP